MRTFRAALVISILLHFLLVPYFFRYVATEGAPHLNRGRVDVSLVIVHPTPTPTPTPGPTLTTPKPPQKRRPPPIPSAKPVEQSLPQSIGKKPDKSGPAPAMPNILDIHAKTAPAVYSQGNVGTAGNQGSSSDGVPGGSGSGHGGPQEESAKPTPTPAPTPSPKGPTREAEAISAPNPIIPASLRTQNIKSYIRVRFEIGADGSFSVTPMGSTGDPQLDASALGTLGQWRWRPALRDGVPVPSVVRVRIQFTVD